MFAWAKTNRIMRLMYAYLKYCAFTGPFLCTLYNGTNVTYTYDLYTMPTVSNS